jgi:hypothetical protein
MSATEVETLLLKRLVARHVLYESRDHEAKPRSIVAQFNFTLMDAKTPGSPVVSWLDLNRGSRLRFILMIQIAAYYGGLKKGTDAIGPDRYTFGLIDPGIGTRDSEIYFEPILNGEDQVVGLRGTVAARSSLTEQDEAQFVNSFGTAAVRAGYKKPPKKRKEAPELSDDAGSPSPPKRRRILQEDSPAAALEADLPGSLYLDDEAVPAASRKMDHSVWLLRACKMFDIEMGGLYERRKRAKFTRAQFDKIGKLAHHWAFFLKHREESYIEICKIFAESAPGWTVTESFEHFRENGGRLNPRDDYLHAPNYYVAPDTEALGSCGARTPEYWPNPAHVIALKNRFARFELLLYQPLPFALGMPLDLSPFQSLVAMIGAHGALLTNVAHGCVDLVDQRAPESLADFHDAFGQLETHRQVMRKFIGDMEELLKEQFKLKGDEVPGLLQPLQSGSAVAIRPSSGPIEVHILPPNPENGGESESITYQVLRQQQEEDGEEDCGDPEGIDQEGEYLMREALQCSSRANLRMGPEIIIGDNFMKRAIINQAAFADLEAKCREQGLSVVETNEAIRLKIDEIGRESLALFWRAKTIAPALKTIRQSILHLVASQARSTTRLAPGLSLSLSLSLSLLSCTHVPPPRSSCLPKSRKWVYISNCALILAKYGHIAF